jgi:bifunctional non-homologous end joining protein LigD
MINPTPDEIDSKGLFIEPCLPTISRMVPTGPGWAYEIKHDGFRFSAVRQGERVRVFSRGGHDWAKQLPSIADAMQALAVTSATIDGEGVICGADGKSDFDRMRACFSRHGAPEAFLYAFDLLELDGRDLRSEPWAHRRALLEQILAASPPGIQLCEHIEDVDGAVVFRAACNMGLEGIVAKRRDSRYRSGRCREWIKIKNPAHAAIERAMLIALSKRRQVRRPVAAQHPRAPSLGLMQALEPERCAPPS